MRVFTFIISFVLSFSELGAQDMTALVVKVKAKLDQVNDYEAIGNMKTDVSFI